MKKLLLSFGILTMAIICLNAQTPQSFKYQAVARDAIGNILADQNIGLRITILEGSAGGTSVYTETHIAHTNQFGLFSINIGQGTVVSGNFSNINWGTNTYFLKTEMDAAGGIAYTLMGTSQLLSVPYALFSENTANVNDADADPGNEIQTISKLGSTVTLSDGGGFFIDEVVDADADPTNELQSISRTGLNVTLSDGGTVSVADNDNDNTNELQLLTKFGNSIKLSNGGAVTDDVDDADNDPLNEIQSISKTGNTVTLTKGGVSFTDAIDDADNNPNNEFQTLSVIGSNLTISNGNTVGIPSGLPSGSLGKTLFHSGINWMSTNNLYNDGINVGIGTTGPAYPFEVNKPVYGGIMSMFQNTAIGAGSAALKSEAVYDTWGYLAVQGDDPFDGHYGMDINGSEIGVLGLSLGTSTSDNYGVYGFSNNMGVYGKHSTSGRIGYLAGLDYGAYGQYTSTRYGYLGGLYGAYGQYNNDIFGYLGGSYATVHGQYESNISGSLGTYRSAVVGEITNIPRSAYAADLSITGSSHLCIGILLNASYTGTNTSASHCTGISLDTDCSVIDQKGMFLDVDHTGTTGTTYGIYNLVNIPSNHNEIGRATYSFIQRDNNSYTSYGVYGHANNGTIAYGIYGFAMGANTNYAGYFNGNVTVTGTFNNPSDRKFKENLSPLSNIISKLKNLNTYSYNYKTTGDASKMNFSKGIQFGFVAQELEEFFPELVTDEVHSYDETIMKDGEEEIEEHSFSYKGINYIGMIPVLTQAVKDQQEIIDNQQAAIEKQQKEIDELKLLVDQLMK